MPDITINIKTKQWETVAFIKKHVDCKIGIHEHLIFQQFVHKGPLKSIKGEDNDDDDDDITR